MYYTLCKKNCKKKYYIVKQPYILRLFPNPDVNILRVGYISIFYLQIFFYFILPKQGYKVRDIYSWHYEIIRYMWLEANNNNNNIRKQTHLY